MLYAISLLIVCQEKPVQRGGQKLDSRRLFSSSQPHVVDSAAKLNWGGFPDFDPWGVVAKDIQTTN